MEKYVVYCCIFFSITTEADVGAPIQLGDTKTLITDVDMDKKGNAFILWKSSPTSSTSSIFANRYDFLSGVLENTATLATDTKTSGAPGLLNQVVTNETGTAVAVWLSAEIQTPIVRDIYAVYYDGTSWGSVEKLNTINQIGPVRNFDVGMDENGNAIVVWLQAKNDIVFPISDHEIFVKRFQVNLGWQIDEKVNALTPVAFDDRVSLIVDNDGNAIVNWRSNWSQFIINPATNAGSWGSVQKLTITLDKSPSSFDVNNVGDIILLSGIQAGIIGSKVQSLFYTSGVGWGTIENVHNDIGLNQVVAMNDSGNAIAVWIDIDSSSNPSSKLLKSSFRDANTGWGAVETIRVAPSKFGITSIDVTYDNDDNASVMWNEFDTTSVGVTNLDGAVYIKHYNEVDGWSADRQLSVNRGLSNYVNLDSNSEGQLIAAWSIIDSSPNIVPTRSWYAVGKIGAGAGAGGGQAPNTGGSGTDSNVADSSSGGGGGGAVYPIILLVLIILFGLRTCKFRIMGTGA